MIRINNFRNPIDRQVPIFYCKSFQIYINHNMFHLYERRYFSEKIILYDIRLKNYKTIPNYNKGFNKNDLYKFI